MSLDAERAQRNREPMFAAWCVGCGLYRLVHGYHRDNCTAKPLKGAHDA
jgi:hypothetical protein